MPYVKDKTLPNYQTLLEDEVLEVLKNQKGIEKVFDDFASKEIVPKKTSLDFAKWNVAPPAPYVERNSCRNFKPVRRNYLAIEQRNRFNERLERNWFMITKNGS